MTTRGGVRSSAIGPAATVAALPATSNAAPGTSPVAPSAETSIGSEQAATPERPSKHRNPTRTGELFQPKPFGGGVRLAATCGGVRSMRTTTSPWPTLPTRSTALAASERPGVSSVTTTFRGDGATATPEKPLSTALQVTVTEDESFQPAALGGGSTFAWTTGAALSSTKEAVAEPSVCSHSGVANAVARTERTPSPDSPVSANVHAALATSEVSRATGLPLRKTTTHRASGVVSTDALMPAPARA